MSLRQRIQMANPTATVATTTSITFGEGNKQDDVEHLKLRIYELEVVSDNLRSLLDISRLREKRLSAIIEMSGMPVGVSLDLEQGELITELPNTSLDQSSFFSGIMERGGWLIGLLIFQSCSSFILSANNELLNQHPTIVYFLTMLVGAGGNAGNQAAVRVIRAIAVGSINEKNRLQFLVREFAMAVALSALLGATGMFRSIISGQASFNETVAVTLALMMIVAISIVLGAILPLLLNMIHIDPAHSSTTIQVIMDIMGVMITCSVANFILHTKVGGVIVEMFRGPAPTTL